MVPKATVEELTFHVFPGEEDGRVGVDLLTIRCLYPDEREFPAVFGRHLPEGDACGDNECNASSPRDNAIFDRSPKRPPEVRGRTVIMLLLPRKRLLDEAEGS